MKIFKREINTSEFITKAFAFGYAAIRIVITFKNPWIILISYVRGASTAAKLLEMRTGTTIHLSDHPHDVITNFVVFGRRDYGKIPRGGTVVDVGANIGTFALYAIQNGANKVYAIEPNSKSFEVLLTNIRENGLTDKIVPIRAAMSNVDGEKVFIPAESSPYNAIESDLQRAGDKLEPVTTLTLHTLAANENLDKIDLLKIDCEGAEFKIIPSIPAALIKKIKCIKVEYLGKDVDVITDYLRSNAFRTTKHEKDFRFNSGMLWAERIE